MKAVLVNYNYDPQWLKEYDFDLEIYDRSDDGVGRAPADAKTYYLTPNIGNVDYDKLDYLIKNYNDLPDIFLWGKTNLFKYITREEFDALSKRDFTPLLTQHHRIYSDPFGQVNFYRDGMYYERNNSWYVDVHEKTRFLTIDDFAEFLGLPPLPSYLPFAPGGNYILTKERIVKHPVSLYKKMHDALSYTKLPAEAQMCERLYHLLWQ